MDPGTYFQHVFPTTQPCGAGTTERQHADSTTHAEAVMFAAEVVCFGVQSGLGVQSGSMGGLTNYDNYLPPPLSVLNQLWLNGGNNHIWLVVEPPL